MEQTLFITSQYILVVFACFLIGCGVLFMYYWAFPSLRKLGYRTRLDLIDEQKEYLLRRQEYIELKKKAKEKNEKRDETNIER